MQYFLDYPRRQKGWGRGQAIALSFLRYVARRTLCRRSRYLFLVVHIRVEYCSTLVQVVLGKGGRLPMYYCMYHGSSFRDGLRIGHQPDVGSRLCCKRWGARGFSWLVAYRGSCCVSLRYVVLALFQRPLRPLSPPPPPHTTPPLLRCAEAAPTRKKGWGRGRKDVPKEELTAMGLSYGEGDRHGPAAAGGVSTKERRGALEGRISVDSMKLRYEEGWVGDSVSARFALLVRFVPFFSFGGESEPFSSLYILIHVVGSWRVHLENFRNNRTTGFLFVLWLGSQMVVSCGSCDGS